MKSLRTILLPMLALMSLPLYSASDLSTNGIKGAIKRFGVGSYYEGKLHSRSITLVDQKGNFTEVHTFDAEKKTGKMVYLRDDQGRITEIRFLTPEGTLRHRVVFQYTTGDLARSSVMYTASGDIAQTTAYTHDANGRILSMTGFTADKKKMFEVYYQYDSEGRPGSVLHRNYAGGLFYKLTFEYEKTDASGNWTQRLRKSWSLQDKLLGTEIEKRVFEYR